MAEGPDEGVVEVIADGDSPVVGGAEEQARFQRLGEIERLQISRRAGAGVLVRHGNWLASGNDLAELAVALGGQESA